MARKQRKTTRRSARTGALRVRARRTSAYTARVRNVPQDKALQKEIATAIREGQLIRRSIERRIEARLRED